MLALIIWGIIGGINIFTAIVFGLRYWHRRKMTDSELVDEFYYDLDR